MCNGCLVLHRDGEVAYCSEELDGGLCSGYDVPHLAGIMACRVTPRGTRCRHCDDVMRNRLIMAPDFVQDYVVSHEVAHLRHMNHGPRFWDLVARLTPDAAAAMTWLRNEGARLQRVGG